MNLLHTQADARSFGFCRAVVFGTWLAVLWKNPISHLADFPREWSAWFGPFKRVPAAVQDAIMTAPVLNGLYCALFVLAALLMLGARPFRPLAIAFAVLVLFYDHLIKSVGGYINHNQMALLYATIIMSAVPASNGFSIFGRSRRAAENGPLFAPTMTIIALAISFPYMFIAMRRFAVGGMDVFLGDAMPIYQATHSARIGPGGNDFGLLVLVYPWLAAANKLGFFLTTIFEAITPLIIFNRVLRYTWLAVMLGMHVLSHYTMNIFFWENMILIFAFYTGLPWWITRRRRGQVLETAIEAEPLTLPQRMAA